MALAMNKRERLHILIEQLDGPSTDLLLSLVETFPSDLLMQKLASTRPERIPLSPVFAQSLREALADPCNPAPDDAIGP
jgi:hypothetical protein